MTQPTSTQAERLFLKVKDLPEMEQSQVLDQTCGDNLGLRKEVETLLVAAKQSESFFDDLSKRLGTADLIQESGNDHGLAGSSVGAYTLIKPIGHGGMGSVWLAERADGRYEGHVAVKMLNPFSGDAAAQRFELEGQYLAKLTHPNIARLLDAGVLDTHQPYLVLELVEGQRIDEYCDQQKLNIQQRVSLFLSVLDAVSHAHANLIIHRDIKPSNIMVTKEGTPKLLDFGIAKLTSAETRSALTQDFGSLLTPDYAAPEQLLGGEITTATDVYSLALLLYTLIVGKSPRQIEKESLSELRAELQKTPPHLSSFVTQGVDPKALTVTAEQRGTTLPGFKKTLQGDLDNVLQKALRYEAEDRYQTVNDLSSDLRRYLRHEPVSAKPDTLSYRIKKFTRRHRGGVFAATLTLLALVAATVVTAFNMLEAKRQRDMAIYQQQRVQASNEFYSLLLEEMDPGGEPLTPAELLDRAAIMLEQQYGSDAPFLARTLYDVSRRYASLRETKKANELRDQAEELARLHNDHDLLGSILCNRALDPLFNNPSTTRQELVAQGLASLRQATTPSHDSAVACARGQSMVALREGDENRALNVLLQTKADLDASPIQSTHQHGILLNDIARIHYGNLNFGQSLKYLEEALNLLRNNGRGNTTGYIQLAGNRIALLGAMGEISAQSKAYEEIFKGIDDLSSQTRIPKGLLLNYGSYLIRQSRIEDAQTVITDIHDEAKRQNNVEMVAVSQVSLAKLERSRGNYDTAKQYLNEAEEAFSENPRRFQGQLLTIDIVRSDIARKQGLFDEARAITDVYLKQYNYPEDKSAPRLPSILAQTTVTELDAENFEQAETMATDMLARVEQTARRSEFSADVGAALVRRAKARIGLGKLDLAQQDLQKAIISLENGLGKDSKEVANAKELLGQSQP